MNADTRVIDRHDKNVAIINCEKMPKMMHVLAVARTHNNKKTKFIYQ